MPRVLIMLNNGIEPGGVDSYLINTLEHMDLSNMDIDIFAPESVSFESIT